MPKKAPPVVEEEEEVTCPVCGKPVGLEVTSCPYCGAEFESEEEEIAFWDTHSAADYVDGSTRVEIDASTASPTKRSVTANVCIKMPVSMLRKVEQEADRLGIPVDTLIARCLTDLARRVHGSPRRTPRTKKALH